jgi:hypothetical protein
VVDAKQLGRSLLHLRTLAGDRREQGLLDAPSRCGVLWCDTGSIVAGPRQVAGGSRALALLERAERTRHRIANKVCRIARHGLPNHVAEEGRILLGRKSYRMLLLRWAPPTVVRDIVADMFRVALPLPNNSRTVADPGPVATCSSTTAPGGCGNILR